MVSFLVLDHLIVSFPIALSQVLKDLSSDFQSKAEAVVITVVVCVYSV